MGSESRVTQSQQLRVTADDLTSRGVYANIVNIIRGPEEVVCDFLLKGTLDSAALVARVVLHPNHAARLGALLAPVGEASGETVKPFPACPTPVMKQSIEGA